MDEHRKRAASFRSIRRGIREISNMIGGCRLIIRVGWKLYGAEVKVRDVKSELEAVMFRDHPKKASVDVYYGPGRD
jgi:hypothetical protein